jgi:hypothetical protein
MSIDSISPASVADFDHEREFERAWADPRYTRTKTVSFDVNEKIQQFYRTSKPLTFTRTMMWDNEVRKGWRPDIYIPSVVRPGSVRNWGGTHSADGLETFARASMIRQWLSPEEFGCVVEGVRAYHEKQKIVFIGLSELRDDSGTLIHADTKQPLYYFEHWVEGAENQPVANWRTLHLTEKPNPLISEVMEMMLKSGIPPGFPEFIPIYIKRALNIGLELR